MKKVLNKKLKKKILKNVKDKISIKLVKNFDLKVDQTLFEIREIIIFFSFFLHFEKKILS